MKRLLVLFFGFYFGLGYAYSQQSFKLHSHNDYLQKVPFWIAWEADCASIELDLVLDGSSLFVAHELETISTKRTLQSLYLEPIQEAVRMEMIKDFDFHLLIDLKSEAIPSLEILRGELDKYGSLLYSADNPRGLKVIISGNRPPTDRYGEYPDYMLFDYQSTDLRADLPWEKIGMVSYSFRRFSVWNGKGRIVEDQKITLEEMIAQVHSYGKPIRFWATPDTKTTWRAMHDLGVDFINTDQPDAAKAYLERLDKNIFTNDNTYDVYKPTYAWEGEIQPLQHIILMIGDGNGLGQISAGLIANGGQLNLTQIKHLGLIKTQAADDFTTDSAAGATALATGHKTNNRAIGVDARGDSIANLPEILDQLDFNSGLVTTDQLTGATPASFYAHHPERDDTGEIARWLPKSPISFLAGGGGGRIGETKEIRQAMGESGFYFEDASKGISTISAQKIVSLRSDVASIQDGRGDWLVKISKSATDFLKSKEKPFFLMIEGAQIDWGGHANDSEMIIRELLDFDKTVGEMMRFVDSHPGTLLIVTADHETGGVSIPQGNLEINEVELGFHSDDHTGVLIPIFSYGVHSEQFIGICDNTEVFHKIMKLVRTYYR